MSSAQNKATQSSTRQAPYEARISPLTALKIRAPLIFFPYAESQISTHPDVRYLVVVHPNSGPGVTPMPGEVLEREVPRLDLSTHVTQVGRVLAVDCRSPQTNAFADVATSAGWAANAGLSFARRLLGRDAEPPLDGACQVSSSSRVVHRHDQRHLGRWIGADAILELMC
ncbi:putative cell surface protein [Diplocarpon rosae]|nr:putative cell surface protein [Diplocarpon rosae]